MHENQAWIPVKNDEGGGRNGKVRARYEKKEKCGDEKKCYFFNEKRFGVAEELQEKEFNWMLENVVSNILCIRLVWNIVMNRMH